MFDIIIIIYYIFIAELAETFIFINLDILENIQQIYLLFILLSNKIFLNNVDKISMFLY